MENNSRQAAPTVEMCESNEEYVPLNDGFNWKGDPNATLSVRVCRSTRRAPIRGCRRRRVLAQRCPRRSAAGCGRNAGRALIAVAFYDPATGEYVGPDGKRYTQADLAHPQNRTWQSRWSRRRPSAVVRNRSR